MHWHAQPVLLKLRGYLAPGGYDRRAPFVASVDITIFGNGIAFASGAIAANGGAFTRSDYMRIAALLRPLGVTRVLAERDGKMVQWDSPDQGSRPMELTDLPPVQVAQVEVVPVQSVPAAVDIELP